MKKLIYLILVVILLSACAKPATRDWSDLPSADQLRENLAKFSGRYNTLDAAATVSLTSQDQFFSTQQFLLLEKPDRLRFDVLTGFGKLVLQLSSDGEELAVHSQTTVPGRYYLGAATAENLSRFTRIPLSTQDMVRILLYDPPMIAAATDKVLVDDDRLVLRLENSQFRQDLLFDDQLLLSGCRYFRADQVFLSVDYNKLDIEKLFPRTIRISMPENELKASIKFSELQLNVAIPGERFSLKKPDNLAVEPIPSL